MQDTFPVGNLYRQFCQKVSNQCRPKEANSTDALYKETWYAFFIFNISTLMCPKFQFGQYMIKSGILFEWQKTIWIICGWIIHNKSGSYGSSLFPCKFSYHLCPMPPSKVIIENTEWFLINQDKANWEFNLLFFKSCISVSLHVNGHQALSILYL